MVSTIKPRSAQTGELTLELGRARNTPPMDVEGVVVLTTDRLILRTFRTDDLPLYAAMNADPEVAEFLGGPATAAYSDEIAAWANECYATNGLGLLAIERARDNQFLGMCGVHEQAWYPDDIEIGWRLARPYWGQGYATEAAGAWLDHAFGPLDLPRVISITDTDNRRSVAVMQRLGLAFSHEARLPDEATGELFDSVIYSVTADQWRHQKA
jgi:RimJ/RimL family protein N-acetyltransferase